MIIDSPIISGSYAATGSLDQVGNVVITGSLTVTEQITGSINSASFAAFAISASNALTASYLSNYIPPFPYTGSAGISGSLNVNGDITASGAIVAQTLYVQTITSSVDFVTGSTRFGSELTNTHLFTGSVTITGSLAVNGSSAILTNQTGAMSVATASYVANAVSASFSQTAISASYASNVPATASFAVSASQAESASYALTASFASNVPATSSFAISASQALSASYALTASYSANVPETASFAVSASQAQNAVSAAYSAYALTSSYSLAGSGFPFSGSAVITGSLLITNLSSSGVSYLVADSTGFITAQSGSAAIFQTQIYTASAGQTTFAITNGYATGLINVFVNGTKLNPSEYTDTNGTTIVLATGSFVDDIVEFNKYLPASGVTNNSLRQQTTFTASAGQTVFSASYTPGLLDIFYNGSHLSNGDFTANNGTFITLATGSAEGDILDVFVYSYQVGAFSGIGGAGVANEISYFNTTNSITSSAAITISGTNAIVTGSLLGTASYAANANLLDGLDSSVFVPTGSFNTFSSSILTYTGSADSRLSSLETTSGSNITRISALESASGSAITRLGALETASGSAITRLSALEVTSGSNITRISALETASGSAITRLSSIETTTGSLNAASGSAITRLSSIESKTGSYATTGSNIFDGGQYLSSSFNPTGFSTTASLYTDGGLRVSRDAYISGTLYLNNVTVFGTQSVAYISSSQLNIGTNLITVNTDTPSIRFGGLAVYDSGSTGLTGSILWDSETNHWIYSNPSGSTYSGGMFISGPRTSTLGSETGTTSCMLLAGQGGDHLTSSMIYHSSTVTCIPNTLIGNVGCFAGNICSNGNVLVGGTGTTNYLPKFTDASTIGNSILSESGYTLTQTSSNALSVYVIKGTGSTTGLWLYTNGANATLSNQDNGSLAFETNGTTRLTLASTGAATFSSSVTAGVLSRIGDVFVGGRSGTYATYTDGLFGDNLHLGATGLTGEVYINTALSRNLIINPVGGNVGIGTTSPEGKLTIQGTSAQPPTSGTTANSLLQIVGSLGGQLNIGSNTVLGEYGSYIQVSDNNLAVPYSLNLQPNGGQVGIGTYNIASVGSALVVAQSNTPNILTIRSTNASNTGAGRLFFQTTNASSTIVNSAFIEAGLENTTTNSYLAFASNTTERMRITSGGTVQPGANGTQDLGTSSLRWATVFTSDLSLSNGIGDYTIVEGENDLFLYNNKQNKVYKFVVEEVDPSTATPKKS
jgi:hypothetical protein